MSDIIFDPSSVDQIHEHYLRYGKAIQRHYYPEMREVAMHPLLLKNAFRFDSQVTDAMLHDLFRVMRNEMAYATSRLFRVYIENGLNSEANDWIRYSEPLHGENFEDWLIRTMRQHPFGVVVNQAERWSDSLARLATDLTASIREDLGKRHTRVEISCFIGNYGYTPFGIHLDDPFTSVIHVHLGPAPKTMYLWKDEIFSQIDGIRHRFEINRLKVHADAYQIRSGDTFILPPHYWHIGETTKFSVGLAIAIVRDSDRRLVKTVIDHALESAFDRHVTSNKAAHTSLATWFAHAEKRYLSSLESNRGLQASYRLQRGTFLIATSPLIALNDAFPPLLARIGETHVVFSRGHQREISEPHVFERVLSAIADGAPGMRALAGVHEHKEGGLSEPEDLLLVKWMIETGSVRVIDDLTSEARIAGPSICSLPALNEAVARLLERDGAHFFDITSLMEGLSRDDVINLLNDVLTRREITSNYELLSEDHVYLHRQRNFHLLVRFIGKSEQDTLYANEFDIFVINPTAEAIAVPVYECPSRPDGLGSPDPLRKLDDIVLQPGRAYRFEAYRHILDFGCDAVQGAFVLIAHSDPMGWLSWIYDRQTLQPIESICTSLQASRIQLYVRLLGEMNANQAVPSLTKLATSDYANFVRWEAVESLSRISPSDCLKVLRQLATGDPDSEIQRAAAQSLKISDAELP
ncbi:HEAT repeat domain-containing protein [Pandoraea sp. NPDC090278]|uniref:HEAT repeat domain-containing protein n=1 Tax=Pandoraea sp. NPDC090278 TaxID=3364391 RepID=UPI00383B8A77